MTPRPYPVAVAGVGNMGAAMAQRLLACGWPVAVHDAVAERAQALAPLGAQVAAHARELAGRLGPDGVLLVVVVDADQIRDVLWGPQGAAQALGPGHTVVLCPTIAPHDTEALAAALAGQGVACVDAPMSGGPLRARQGAMSLMLAGDPTTLERRQTLWADLANPCFAISDRPGDGARTKLVNNLLAGINLVGAAEALHLAETLGLDPSRTLDVIERSSGQSWIGSDRMRRAVAGDFEPRAHMTLLQKDTRLAMEAARRLGLPGVLGAPAAQAFADASAAGWQAHDDGALLQWLRQLPTMPP
jgi:L-threonate 2-dehydrogenase